MRSTTVALLQGIYFTITGIWPLLHIDSFMWVTGPKTDIWLVKTVGLMITAVGIGLLTAYRDKNLSNATIVTAVLSSFFLMGVDVYYVWKGVIANIYLLDALAEVLLLGLWGVSRYRKA